MVHPIAMLAKDPEWVALALAELMLELLPTDDRGLSTTLCVSPPGIALASPGPVPMGLMILPLCPIPSGLWPLLYAEVRSA
jgi:hypothetical protein